MNVYGLDGEAARCARLAAEVARAAAAPAAADVDARGRFPAEALDALRQAGLLGLCVPSGLGGLGQGPRAFVGAVEELAQACGSTAMVFVMHVCAQQAIAASDTLGGRNEVLREMAAGRHLGTLALSEQGSRSQFWAPVSGLAPDVNGGFVTHARVTADGHADSMVSSAQKPAAASPLESTLYLVRRGAQGLSVAGRASTGWGCGATIRLPWPSTASTWTPRTSSPPPARGPGSSSR